MDSNETICFFGDFKPQTLSSNNLISSNELLFYDNTSNLDSILKKFNFPLHFRKENNKVVFTVPDNTPLSLSVTIGSGTAEDCAISLLAYSKGAIGLDLYDIFSALQNGTTAFFGNLSENKLREQNQILKNAMGAYIFFRLSPNTDYPLDFAVNIVSQIDDHCNNNAHIVWTAITDESIAEHTFDLFLANNKEELLV